MDDQFFDLKGKRESAKISQSEMAEYLNVTQGMISRYEADPESVPGGTLRKWHQICGDISNSKGIEIDNPRMELVSRLSLIESYLGTESLPAPSFAADRIPVTPKDFLSGAIYAGRKPRIGVFGKFDAGKSRLLNSILGGNRLPTGYQPATSVICLIRHINEKPVWQAEDVWIMKKGFNLDLSNDQDHCTDHRLVAGGYDSLKQYGTHGGSSATNEAHAAVVYVDAPFLLSADLIDLPGFGNKESDNERAEVGKRMVDALIYLSPANGFMDGFEVDYFSALLGSLPVYDLSGESSDALRNIFVVATHAHSAPSSERPGILSGGASRSGKHLSIYLQQRYTDKSVDESSVLNDFSKRFFSFSADDCAIRDAFLTDLTNFAISVYPNFTLMQLQSYIKQSKSSANEAFSRWCDELTHAINEREKAQAEIIRIKDGEQERQIKRDLHANKIGATIKKYASESQLHISTVFNAHSSAETIETVIRQRYDDKKEAQQLAHSYVLNSIQTDINNGIKVKAAELGEEIDEFLKGFAPSIDREEMQNIGWSFNPRVAFISALSGVGTVGALATWATIAAAGSNLGGYILIGQVVGWLSSIGISVGGAATVMSFVSAIGGPITLAIGLGLAATIAVFGIFGDSWQTKLAKKINSEIIKQNVKKQLSDGIDKFWKETQNAFDEAAKQTEIEYQRKLTSLEDLAFNTDQVALKKELEYAEEIRGFFAGIPWRTIQK